MKMKKLITILAIMMVVFGVAFAATETTTGNEELKVTCLVKFEEPKFTLYGGTSNSTSSETLTTAGEVVEGSAHATTSIAMSQNAIIDGDVTLYFVVKQTNNNVKSTTKYKFSATATVLSDGTSATGHTTGDPTVSALAAVGTDLANARDVEAGYVQYGGLKCDAADVQSFNVKWPKTDLVPSETAYYAYVKLNISVN